MEQEIDLLLTFLLAKQKLTFGKAELSVAHSLEEKGFLTPNGDNYEVGSFGLIAPQLLEAFKKSIAFEETPDFSKAVNLLKNFEKHFEPEGFSSVYNRLEEELWKVIIVEANSKYRDDFQEYIKNLDKETRYNELFSFIEVYSELLPVLELSAATIYKNANTLQFLTECIDESRYEPAPAAIFHGVRQVSEQDVIKGKLLLHIALEDNPIQSDILAAIITGLYSQGRNVFYQQDVGTLFQRLELQMPILNGLSAVRQLEESDIALFIDLTNKSSSSLETILSGISLLFSILTDKNPFEGKEKYVDIIFCKIKEYGTLPQPELIYRILGNISFLRNYDKERIETVLFLLQQPHFTLEKYGVAIGRIFFNLRSVPALEKVLLAIAIYHPFTSVSSYFESDYGRFEKVDYDEMLVNFITNDKASIRFVGINLFTHHCLRGNYRFSKNILELEPMQQYKLWVGMTQDYKEPRYCLPVLFPLLHSTSGMVREAFTCKLEEYSRNYGNQVIKVLESLIDKNNQSDLEVLERIRNHRHSFYEENIAPKEYLKELNPYYTHHKLFANFHKLHYKTIQTKMTKNVEEHGFLKDTGKNIELAKGGGWKLSGRDTISKLGMIETSYSFPRDYFIFPNQFDREESVSTRTDWEDDDFILIQEIIENE